MMTLAAAGALLPQLGSERRMQDRGLKPLITNPPNIVLQPAPYLAFKLEAAWRWPLKAGDEWGIAAGSQAPWVAGELCRSTKRLRPVSVGFPNVLTDFRRN